MCVCVIVCISRVHAESVLRAIRGASSVKKTGKNTEAEERRGRNPSGSDSSLLSIETATLVPGGLFLGSITF